MKTKVESYLLERNTRVQCIVSNMFIWWTFLTWLLVARFSDSQDNEIPHKDRRLLLNDPNTLLNEIENLKREMTSLKSQVDTLQNRKQEGK